MSRHSFPTSMLEHSMPSQSEPKGNREWGNEEGDMEPRQFLPFTTTTPKIPSSWNLCFGWQDSKESELAEPQRNHIRILHEVDLEIEDSFDDLLQDFSKSESDITIGFLDGDWERRSVNPKGSLNRILNFVSLHQESCYYSSISKRGGSPVMEICYNACEGLSFDIDEQSSDRGPRSVILHKTPLPVYFRYDILAKKAIYILGNAPRATEAAIRRFSELVQEKGELVHHFSLHLVILQSVISIRDVNMAYDLKSLLLIEDALLDGSLMATQSLDKFRQQMQELHELSRSMVITEHYNDRDLSNLRSLMRDMERLEKEGEKLGEGEGCGGVDVEAHERLRDGLACLLDFCVDRARRVGNRKQRVQNLIGLLYNLTANRDSMASLKIAEESTKIAHETRKDSMAMKTIATLTMLYLPASFVCSVFGTNFFALDTDGEDRSFVVSKLWWLIVVVAVPVTLTTYGVWLWWMKRGVGGENGDGEKRLRRKGSHEC